MPSPMQIYNIEDLVWAKMKGYPPWPARIVKTPDAAKVPKHKNSHYFVFFFGSNDHAWIHDENIVPHSEHMIQKTNKYKSAKFRNAIKLITYYSKNNINKNKRTDNKCIKSKSGKISETNETKTLNRSRSVKYTIKKTKTSERKHFNTQNRNLSAVKAQKKSIKTPLQVIGDVMFAFKKRQNEARRREKNNSLQNKNLSTVKAVKKPFKSPFQTNGFKLCSASKILENNDHNKHSLTPEISSSCSQSAVSLDGDDIPCKRTEFIENSVIPKIVATTSGFLIENNIKHCNKKIGFLGLGLIGSCSVRRLLNSGHSVSIYNKTQEECDHFVKAGAHKCVTPADVVAVSDIIFSCVSGPDEAKDLVFGKFGVLSGLKKHGKGKSYVEMTAVDSYTVEKCSSVISKAGSRYLEAPVHGSRTDAEKGKLVVIAGGDHSLYLDCATYFQTMGAHSVYIDGTIGKASKVNAVLTAFVSFICVSLAETMAIADNNPYFSKADFMHFLKQGSLNCPEIIEKAEAMVQRNFAPNTTVKDIQNILASFTDITQKLNTPLPVLTTALKMFKLPALQRYEDQDISSIYEVIKV